MLFSANFFTNEVTNAKAVIKFGTEANKKIQPKVVAHVSFAQQKSAFAGFKAHREALIAAGFGVDGKLPNGIRKAIDRVKPAKDVAVDHIVTFTVKNSSELFHLVIAGDTAIVSAPNMDFQDTADCQITFGRRKEVTGKAKLNFTKSGNPYFAVFFNSHATEKEVVELVAYEGEEKERIESCEAFLELEAQVNAVSPVVEDRFAALEAQIAELKAALEEKDQIIEAQKAEIEELKAKEVAPVAVVENAADEAANDEVEVKIDVMRDPMAALQLLRSFKGKSHFSSDAVDEEEEQKRNAAMLHDEMYGTNFSYCQ
ncbi:hypothetical protein DZF63_003674 [Escherichia coli]|jgi:hypothetical protein|uniref:hypothetical protein n=1 Tax=Enterobacteriaceae TaxID=543 RepID=UPI000B7DC4C3|nr:MULTISPECIES: hypothetical protein [Enterobacteriaceae]EEW3328682.1 hypothetical protein [Escherichia albertii]EEQ8867268.1 hypothetical protein [Escherichia coli]EER1859902.1 hypothetical protein [Escherichia coli]EER2445056.1 hypothetical protein [Escherichia coli]EER5147859.1 hypothetical protein [Escherichia coli]